MSETINVKGLSELAKFLDELPNKLQRNVMRSALRAGAKPIQESAEANAPVRTGELRTHITVSTRARGGQVTASVGAREPYAVLVEYGTQAHFIRAQSGYLKIGGYGFAKLVHHPGAKPKPFMRPALDARAQDAVVAVGEQLKARLTKEGLDAADVLIEGDQ